jgi:hypothetical protein
MGHQPRTNSALAPLGDRLNRYPIGLADSATLRWIRAVLFDEREGVRRLRPPAAESLPRRALGSDLPMAELAGADAREAARERARTVKNPGPTARRHERSLVLSFAR